MATELYPLRFRPVYRHYIWGGRNLERVLGRPLPPGRIAESWEISAHPHGQTPVANGPLAGTPLGDLVARFGVELVGQRSRRALELGRFPLLVKLLDANRWLSVQVHPDDEYALAHEQDLGKTEMWVVLHAEPGAELILGLRRGVDPARFQQALAEGQIESCLHRLQVHQGDVIFVPAGTVHALGPGLIVAEIQQASDTTYRLYDWGRVGDDGKPRPLHLRKALEVIDWGQVEPGPVSPQPLESGTGHRAELLVRCPHFQTERWWMDPGHGLPGETDDATFQIWGLLSGRAQIHWAGEPVPLEPTSWTLIPASLGKFTLEPLVSSHLLRVFVPGP